MREVFFPYSTLGRESKSRLGTYSCEYSKAPDSRTSLIRAHGHFKSGLIGLSRLVTPVLKTYVTPDLRLERYGYKSGSTALFRGALKSDAPLYPNGPYLFSVGSGVRQLFFSAVSVARPPARLPACLPACPHAFGPEPLRKCRI